MNNVPRDNHKSEKIAEKMQWNDNSAAQKYFPALGY